MPIQSTPRWSLPYPKSTAPRTDTPDVPRDVKALALALDDVAKDDQGILSSRPTSSFGTPGKSGRYYLVKGDASAVNNGILWRDNGTGWDKIAHIDPVSARVYNSGAIGIPTGTITLLTFDTENYDEKEMHTASGSRLTVPVAGDYLIVARIYWALSSAGSHRTARLRVNGSADVAVESATVLTGVSGNGAANMSVSETYRLAAGNYVECLVDHDAGSTINVVPPFSFSATLIR